MAIDPKMKAELDEILNEWQEKAEDGIDTDAYNNCITDIEWIVDKYEFRD